MKFINRKFYLLLSTSSIAMVITSIMLLSDSIVAGQLVGGVAVSSVNLVIPIFSTIAFVSVMISIGTSANYSYQMGKFKKKQADKFFGQGVILAICSGIVMFFLIVLGKPLYFDVLSPSGLVLEHASAYYKFFPYIALIYPTYTLLADLVYADGDELICNISYGIQIVGNLFFSVLLCSSMGIQGISLGTLIGTVLAIVVLLLHFLRKGNSLKPQVHICFKDVKAVVKFGVTDGLQFLLNAILVYALNKFIINNFESAILPTLSLVVSVMEIGVIYDGIGQALSPLLGVYRGENNNKGIANIVQTAQRVAIVEGIFFCMILLIFANNIPTIFGLIDTEIIASSAVALRIMATTQIFSALTYLYTSYYLFMEKMWLSISITLVNDLIAILVVGTTLAMIIGINGLWIGFAVAPVVALVFGGFIVFVRFGKACVPLLFPKKGNDDIFIFDLILTHNNMINLRDDVELVLKDHKLPETTINKVALLIEELTTLILFKNPDKKIYLECTIMLKDGLKVIFRDSGVLFDITDVDMTVSSLNAYVVSRLMENRVGNANLTTMGYNRNEFIF